MIQATRSVTIIGLQGYNRLQGYFGSPEIYYYKLRNAIYYMNDNAIDFINANGMKICLGVKHDTSPENIIQYCTFDWRILNINPDITN